LQSTAILTMASRASGVGANGGGENAGIVSAAPM
jgi:hypothetical protein